MAKSVYYCLSIFIFLSFVAHSYGDCIYVVNVKTGNIANAGTNAMVQLKLYDKQGNSVDVTDLAGYGSGGKDFFERGQLDKFIIPGKCLSSEVCKIRLSHNNGGNKPGWFVDYLDVTTFSMQLHSTTASARRFNINRWLALDEKPYSLSVEVNQCGNVIASII